MNHAIAGVNEGYITRDKLLNDLLRVQQEKLSAQILSFLPTASREISSWLSNSRIAELEDGWAKNPGQGFRIYISEDPYHPIRKAKRIAARANLATLEKDIGNI